MDISLILESLLATLLGATLVYCVILERRLRNLRTDQNGLIAALSTLNRAIAGAEHSVAALKSAAAEASEELSTKLSPARALVDELSLLTASGERIADKIAYRSDNERKSRLGVFGEALRAVR